MKSVDTMARGDVDVSSTIRGRVKLVQNVTLKMLFSKFILRLFTTLEKLLFFIIIVKVKINFIKLFFKTKHFLVNLFKKKIPSF